MSLNLKLTDEQLEKAVELFAEGYSRSKIVSHFMETDENLQEQAKSDENRNREIRIMISQQLRAADPSSSRFASTKYQGLFDLHFEAKAETIKTHYEMIINRSTSLMEEQIEKINTQLQTLEAAVNRVTSIRPITFNDYISLLKMTDTLNKRLLETTDQLLERLGTDPRMNQRTNDSPNTDG